MLLILCQHRPHSDNGLALTGPALWCQQSTDNVSQALRWPLVFLRLACRIACHSPACSFTVGRKGVPMMGVGPMQVPVTSTRGHGVSLEANSLQGGWQGPLSSSRMVAAHRHGVARPEQRQSPSKSTQREPFCHPYRHSHEHTQSLSEKYRSALCNHVGPWSLWSRQGNKPHTVSVFLQPTSLCPYWAKWVSDILF